MSRFVPDVQKTSVANRNPSQLLTMLVTQMDKVELRGLCLRRKGTISLVSVRVIFYQTTEARSTDLSACAPDHSTSRGCGMKVRLRVAQISFIR